MACALSIGGGDSYLYMDDVDLASRLRKQFPNFGTYQRPDRTVFAWQLKVPSR